MNTTPPATLDGQPVIVTKVATTTNQDHEIGDSWPTGSKGNCLCVTTQAPFPKSLAIGAVHGGSENFFQFAVDPNFDDETSIKWQGGLSIDNLPDREVNVLIRNCDPGHHGGTFPPAHPPKSNTLTKVRAYRPT